MATRTMPPRGASWNSSRAGDARVGASVESALRDDAWWHFGGRYVWQRGAKGCACHAGNRGVTGGLKGRSVVLLLSCHLAVCSALSFAPP